VYEPGAALIDGVVDKLESDYSSIYGASKPDCRAAIATTARMALERISTCDALYHNVNHTVLVTLVGQEILKGKLSLGGSVSEEQWLHFVVGLLCHDIGYVRGLCRADIDGVCASGIENGTVTLSPQATDASLGPYHVDRSSLFVRERFSDHALVDPDEVVANIERTRFPVPDHDDYRDTEDDPGLTRAADLLGQVAEPQPRRRYPALYYEFEETGINDKLGYSSPQDLRLDFPRFYSKVVVRYCAEAMHFLEATEDGRQWLANLNTQLAEA